MEAECNSKESDTFDSQSSLAVRFLTEQIREGTEGGLWHLALAFVQGEARLG